MAMFGYSPAAAASAVASFVDPTRYSPPADDSDTKQKFGWVDAIGALGDALSSAGGGQATYLPVLMQQRELAEKRRQRQQDYAQQVALQREKALAAAANKEPYRWRDNAGNLMEIGPDGQVRTAYKDPTDKLNWIQARDPVTGALSIIPVGPNGPIGMEGGGPASPQPGAVNAPAQSDGGFLTFDQYRSMQQGMGGGGFSAWQGKFGTPVEVTSKDQMDALPSGTRFVAPDGSVRTKR